MKAKIYHYLCLIPAFILASGCEDIIDLKLDEVEPIFVVDAWLNTSPETQTILLSETQPYYDSSAVIPLNATSVTVQNISSGQRFDFTRNQTTGAFQWNPNSSEDSLAKATDTVSLTIIRNDVTYTSFLIVGDVPAIDSLEFLYDDSFGTQEGIVDDAYFLNFISRDLPEIGNLYWIKAFKNNNFLNDPSEINVAFDAGFSAGGVINNVQFIEPIRDAVNRIESVDDTEALSPYNIGDVARVEIHSLNPATFSFLTEFSDYVESQGAFEQLFSAPFTNFDTNITAEDSDGKEVEVRGFFNIARVSKLSDTLTETKARIAKENFQKGLN